MDFSNIPTLEILLAAYLGLSGVRKRSLSPSGGLAAFLVGSTILAVRLRTFGLALIIFYLVGSKATKVGKLTKAKLEEGHQEAGYRNAAQVLCNSCSAYVAAMIWAGLFVGGSWQGRVLEGLGVTGWGRAYDSSEWCAVDSGVSVGWSRKLVFIALGYATFSCAREHKLTSMPLF